MATSRTRYCSRCLTTFPADVERCPNLGCRAVRSPTGWGELMEEGDLIDRTYRIHQRLAIGGAGVTYLGREVDGEGKDDGPRLAIKMLYQQRDQGPYLRRLATEAQILQGLHHPHIVEYMGFVHRAGHSPYLVTRYEEGGSLLDHIRRVGLLSVPVAAAIGRQVCSALAVAHQQGVIHRDLKPENVLIEGIVGADEVPRLRVADFGIAKVFGGVGDRLTRVGAFVGTPQYAAPEQFEGAVPEPATDVYAVGALIYFCLAARPVADFMGELDPDSQRDHLVAHLPPKIPREGQDPDMVDELEAILALSMAVSPGDRIEITALEARLAPLSLSAGRLPAQRLSTAPLAPSSPAPPLPPPLPPGDLHTEDVPPAASRTADPPTAKSSSRGVRPPPLPGTEASEAPDRPRGGAVPATIPVIVTTPVRRSGERVEKGRGTRPSTLLGIGAVAGFGALAVLLALAIGFWVFTHQSVTITSREKDPTRLKDWQLVAGALGTHGPEAQRSCKAPPFQTLDVVVDGKGALRELSLPEYRDEPTRACFEDYFRAVRFQRAGTEDVRVVVKLQK